MCMALQSCMPMGVVLGIKMAYYTGRMGQQLNTLTGKREWYQKDLLHRLDGPAIEYPDGHREWLQQGRWHRLDGPAIEYPDGRRAWHINGKELTETEWQQTVASMGLFGRTRTI